MQSIILALTSLCCCTFKTSTCGQRSRGNMFSLAKTDVFSLPEGTGNPTQQEKVCFWGVGAKLERALARRKPANHQSREKSEGWKIPNIFNYITFKNKVHKIALKRETSNSSVFNLFPLQHSSWSEPGERADVIKRHGLHYNPVIKVFLMHLVWLMTHCGINTRLGLQNMNLNTANIVCFKYDKLIQRRKCTWLRSNSSLLKY